MGGLDIVLIVVGGLNTDIVALGVDRLLSPGELTRSGRLHIGAGGKSCNLARMAAAMLGPGRVAMAGKTSRDPFGLWRVPLEALREDGVDTTFVKVVEHAVAGEYPGVALIAVSDRGENQIYCLPGVSDSFGPRDIDDASGLFAGAAETRMLALTLELPLQTAVYAVGKAVSRGMKVVLDPGGIKESEDYGPLLGMGIHLLAPNEHEAGILTGVEVEGMDSAREAARSLLGRGVANLVITHGAEGAYVFCGGEERHIAAPCLRRGSECDETGCGDQVTAVLCAEMIGGKDIWEASEAAVLAGTMQYRRTGIQPVNRDELEIASREVTDHD